MAGPFTTPVAFSTPFLSEPDRSNGFTSKNVQEAIEEALSLAIANDRFKILCQYNGNANNGRLLEFFSGIDSDDAPFHFNANTNVIDITCSTTGVNSISTIGFYNKSVDPTYISPLYILDMNGQKTKEDIGTALAPLFLIPIGGELVVRVDSASIQKPHMQITFSSAI